MLVPVYRAAQDRHDLSAAPGVRRPSTELVQLVHRTPRRSGRGVAAPGAGHAADAAVRRASRPYALEAINPDPLAVSGREYLAADVRSFWWRSADFDRARRPAGLPRPDGDRPVRSDPRADRGARPGTANRLALRRSSRVLKVQPGPISSAGCALHEPLEAAGRGSTTTPSAGISPPGWAKWRCAAGLARAAGRLPRRTTAELGRFVGGALRLCRRRRRRNGLASDRRQCLAPAQRSSDLHRRPS